jgi:hypothetical protein
VRGISRISIFCGCAEFRHHIVPSILQFDRYLSPCVNYYRGSLIGVRQNDATVLPKYAGSLDVSPVFERFVGG